jgi:hypothetical protein
MEMVTTWLGIVGIFTGGVVALKIFFTLWGPVDRRLNPDKLLNAVEASFRRLREKRVDVHLLEGDVLRDCTYRRTLHFDAGEFAANPVYFEFEDPEGRTVLVPGARIGRIVCPA